MSNRFNKDKFNRLFRIKRFDLEEKHKKEFQNYIDEITKINAFNSGITIKKRLELKQKQFQELSQILIDSLIESFGIDEEVMNGDKESLIKETENFTSGFIAQEKSGLESALLSYGYRKGSLIEQAQINVAVKLNQINNYTLDKLKIRIEEHNDLINKERKKNQNEIHSFLEQEQINTLCLLIEAYRNVESKDRKEFVVTRDSSSESVLHPGFNNGWIDISIVDLRILDSLNFIKILEKDYPNIEFKFNITPIAFKYFEEINQKNKEPIKRVENEILTFIELDTFKNKYENAYKKWKEAETLLWKADNKMLYSSVGHLCREAVQEFLDKLIIQNNLQSQFTDKTKTKNRFEGILQSKKDSLGNTLPEFFISLMNYWNSLIDLIQRQEHSGLKEGEEIKYNDARRIVFQTAVLFYEISKTI